MSRPPADPRHDPAVLRLERLRAGRVRPPRATALAASLEREGAAILRLRRALGDAGSAWGRCCPEELASGALPVACRAGVLTVAVADAAVRHRVDRWLRAGGQREVAAASRTPIRRVRLVIGRHA